MDDVNNFILESQDKVRGGEMVSLAGLDEKVATICAQVVALPADDAHDLQPLMAEMIGHLESLSNALKEFKDSLQ